MAQVIRWALILLLGLALMPPAAHGQPAAGEHFSLEVESGGIRISWGGRRPEVPAAGWAMLTGRMAPLPVRLTSLLVSGNEPIVIRTERLESRPAVWTGADELPEAPAFVLREGRIAGSRVAVIAISPRYGADQAREASDLSIFIPNARPFDARRLEPWTERNAALADVSGPTNPAFGRLAARVVVTDGGIQRIGAATLAAAGLDLRDPNRLRLWRNGIALPLERGGAGAELELRFFAPAPGDRWNRAATYWLTVEELPGPSLAVREVTPGAAPRRTTALEIGEWRAPTTYESRLPGADGDYWFNRTLRAGAGAPAAGVQFPLTSLLPAATGPLTLTVQVSAATPGPHTIDIASGAMTASRSWQGEGDHTLTMSLGGAEEVSTLTLAAGAAPSVVALDSLAIARPVQLAFDAAGARFRGVPGRWRYHLGGFSGALYDVSDPDAPTRLIGATDSFEDAGSRDYLALGSATAFAPEVRPAPAMALPDAGAAIYIAPAALHKALEPLLALRRAQGVAVALVDVQTLYDAWSGGHVEPEAIRAFLRYAAARWPEPPRTVTLVGDGTADPHGYSVAGGLNLIPPYLAPVDPWLGETACEACMAQLDGPSPLDDWLPDLALGRLPVKSVEELTALVAKLIGYETTQGGLEWRSRAVFIADNPVEADGRRDRAGDFTALSEAGIAALPEGVQPLRVYYDPWVEGTKAPLPAQPWREPDAVAARRQTLAALERGAGLVTYAGHSHHWQWAATGPPAPSDQQFLLGLNDAGLLGNGARLPIVLGLTCLTAAFQKPAVSGTTLDERLLLNPHGGAAAVWGPTGMGVAYGHDALQRGFHNVLWERPERRMGELTQGGQLELFTASGCCQEALRTYALLGDPLTVVQVRPAAHIALPLLGSAP